MELIVEEGNDATAAAAGEDNGAVLTLDKPAA